MDEDRETLEHHPRLAKSEYSFARSLLDAQTFGTIKPTDNIVHAHLLPMSRIEAKRHRLALAYLTATGSVPRLYRSGKIRVFYPEHNEDGTRR